MSLIFPSLPNINDTTVTGGKTWTWDGSRWLPSGAVGYQGSTGYQGSVGYRGSSGDTGYQGSQGYTGSVGYVGSQGIQGVQGYRGTSGFTGSQGVQGDKGDIGYVGSAGVGYVGSAGTTLLAQLSDVITGTPANGYVLTYLSQNDKYNVIPLSVSDTTLSNTVMDGGNF